MKAATVFLFQGRKVKVRSQKEQQFTHICHNFENQAYDLIKGKLLYYYNGEELNQQLKFKDLNNPSNEIIIQVEESLIQNKNNSNIISQSSPNPVQTPVQNNKVNENQINKN